MKFSSIGRLGRIIIIAIVLIVALGATGGGLYFFYRTVIKASFDAEIGGLQNTINGSTVEAYVASSDIRSGEVVTEDKLTRETVLLSKSDGLFTAADFGRVALVDIGANSIVFASSVGEVELSGVSDRLTELSCFYIPKSVREGAYIDVRIRFQTGEDFVVLSKKRIESVSDDFSSCVLCLDEKEVHRISSAIIDMKNWSATIYANLYTAASLQSESIVTYVPNMDALELLSKLGLVAGEELKDAEEYRTKLDERILANTEDRQAGGRVQLQHSDIRDTTEPGGGDIGNENGQGLN